MSGLLVCIVSGSVIIPRFTSRPACSASDVSGRTPTAKISKSQSSTSPFLSSTAVIVLPFETAFTTVFSRWNFIPCCSKNDFTDFALFSSRILGKTLGASSPTSTLLQIFCKPSAAFIPISPAPITTALVFSFASFLTPLTAFRSRNVSAFFLPLTFSIGGINGFEPVARQSLSYGYSFRPDFTTFFFVSIFVTSQRVTTLILFSL